MRVLIIDDHPLYRDALRALLAGLDPALEAVEAANVAEAAAAAAGIDALDLVLLDMHMPGVARLDALAQVRALFDSVPLVVVSADTDPKLMLQVVDAGASGYIPKAYDSETAKRALQLVLAHGVYLPVEALQRARSSAERPPMPTLSERQRAVLTRLLQGKANKVIARELDIAEGTVKAHLWAVYQVLGVQSRSQAMCRAHELGLFGTLV